MNRSHPSKQAGESPKKSVREELDELRQQVEDLDQEIETVAELDVEIENAEGEREKLIDEVITRLQDYRKQVILIERREDLTEEEQRLVKKLKEAIQDLLADIDYDAELFQTEESERKKRLRKAAIDMVNGSTDRDFRRIIDEFEDGSLGAEDADFIVEILNWLDASRYGYTCEYYLLPKIADNTFTKAEPLLLIAEFDIGYEVKLAFLDKFAPGTESEQKKLKLMIDLESGMLEDYQFVDRMKGLDRGTITEDSIIELFAGALVRAYPGMIEMMEDKVAPSKREYYRYWVRYNQLSELLWTRGRDKAPYSGKREERALELIDEFEDGSITDEVHYKEFFFLAQGYLEAQMRLTKKIASFEMEEPRYLKDVLNYTDKNSVVQSLFLTPGNIERLIASVQTPRALENALNDWGFAGKTPRLQRMLVEAYEGETPSRMEFMGIDRGIDHYPTRIMWLKKMPDGAMDVDPMTFMLSYAAQDFELVYSKIKPERWERFLSNPKNYYGYQSRQFWRGEIDSVFNEEDNKIAQKYSGKAFGKVSNYGDDLMFLEYDFDRRPINMQDKIENKNDLLEMLALDEDLEQEDIDAILDLWDRYKEGKGELERFIAGKITGDLVRSEGYAGEFVDVSKYHTGDTPHITCAILMELPDEYFHNREFVEGLIHDARYDDAYMGALEDIMSDKIDIEFEEPIDLENMKYSILMEIEDYPGLLLGYFKNIRPGSIDVSSVDRAHDLRRALISANNSPEAQMILLRGSTNMDADAAMKIVEPWAREYNDQVYTYVAREMTDNIWENFKDSQPGYYSREERDLVTIFEGHPEAQQIIMEALLPYVETMRRSHTLRGSVRWSNVEEDIPFLRPSNKAKVAEEFVLMINASGLNTVDFFSKVYPLFKDDLTERNIEEYRKLNIALGEHSVFLLRNAYPSVREEFLRGGYEATRPYWETVVEIMGMKGYGQAFVDYAVPNMGAELQSEESREVILNVMRWNPEWTLQFLQYPYRFIDEPVDFTNEEELKEIITEYAQIHEVIGSQNKRFYMTVENVAELFDESFMDMLQIITDFCTGENQKIVEHINSHYESGSRDLEPLKATFFIFYAIGHDELLRFTQEIDIETIVRPYREEGNVEEKVLVARALMKYMQTEQERVVEALALTKEEVDAFLQLESDKDDPKLSNYYYIIQGYDLLGSDVDKVKVLEQIDFDKLIAERLSTEVFGILEYLDAPVETWAMVIDKFELNLDNLDMVEATRRKLMEISPEKANQVIEFKAQQYVEEPITVENLPKKVKFVRIWLDPNVTIPYHLDPRFILDLYTMAAERMKSKIKEYCMDLDCDCGDIESFEIFSEEELDEIRRTRMVYEEVVVQAPRETVAPTGASGEDRRAMLRRSALDSTQIEGSGMIEDKEGLEERLRLFEAFEEEGLEGQMNMIRDQIISYINTNGEEALEEAVMWKGESKPLKDVLPDLEIEMLESADNWGARMQKAAERDAGYTAQRAGQMLSQKKRKAMERMGLRGTAVQVEEGLRFESGFSGGGEKYEGGRVELTEQDVWPSASLYTVERGGDTEAIVVRFDPRAGARFDFEVQVGATTEGNKGNLTEVFQRRYGNKLIMDTVGSMVQGAGMPISMIFENGEPKNKKTTMGGQRDGLVMFNPSGKMEIVNKTRISYWEMALLTDLNSFESELIDNLNIMEEAIDDMLPEGMTLDHLSQSDPGLVRQYSQMVAMKELFDKWKAGVPLNYSDQSSYMPQELFWMIAKHGQLSGFLESLFVEFSESKVQGSDSGAHRRLLVMFSDRTYGIYDSRVAMGTSEVAQKVSELEIDGESVIFAVNLDTGMADDTRLYDKEGDSYQIGYTSQPVGSNRIAIYHGR